MLSRHPAPWGIAALLVFAFGCEEGARPSRAQPSPKVTVDQVTGAGSRVQVRFGGDGEPPRLPFTITRVYQQQAPSKAAPFHVGGGEWTYFDAALEADPKASFTVGVGPERGGGGIAFGKVRLASPSRDAGQRFVAQFARAFQVKVPAPVAEGTLQPVEFATAVLGSGLRRDPDGLGPGGTWHASKWFPALDGVEAEVFFNYDLEGKQGELSQKDADYDADVLAVLATVLRDGLPAERTPENDATLAATGPTFAELKQVGSGAARLLHFGPRALLVSERRGEGEALLSVDLGSAKATELAVVKRTVDGVFCPGDDTSRCLVRETMPKERGVISSDDPSRYWLLKGQALTPVPLVGDAKRELTRAPLSPDGRYVALQRWENKKPGPGAYTTVEIIDLSTGRPLPTVRQGEDSFDVVGWSTKRPVAEVELERGFPFHEPEEREAYDFEFATGKLTRVARPLKGSATVEPSTTSPDGKRQVKYEDGALTVAEGKQRRQLALHPADLRFASQDAFRWVSPRFLSFRAARFAFVDTDTMKLSFPLASDDKSQVSLSADLRTVLLSGEGGRLRLGKVVLPAGKAGGR